MCFSLGKYYLCNTLLVTNIYLIKTASPRQIDNKKWQDDDCKYLKLPWKRGNGEELDKTWNFGLAPSSKDCFAISTTFCSTKLTQNGKIWCFGCFPYFFAYLRHSCLDLRVLNCVIGI